MFKLVKAHCVLLSSFRFNGQIILLSFRYVMNHRILFRTINICWNLELVFRCHSFILRSKICNYTLNRMFCIYIILVNRFCSRRLSSEKLIGIPILILVLILWRKCLLTIIVLSKSTNFLTEYSCNFLNILSQAILFLNLRWWCLLCYSCWLFQC